ncbi:1-deoxy-D-xylulose-5-phosphate synthase [Streptomyces sp. NPDC014861]|uniref:1-deoxy-D-xylulose-5-phosphate synthase n=1 Tax=Streptomyces sp. NPDC014861 TaxID=3364923 RepID=UPI0036F62579
MTSVALPSSSEEPPTAAPTDLLALRSLPDTDLPALADRIRSLLVDKVTAAGGHLGPNLGVVELTLALYRVFDSPRDTIVFDTGHQAYVSKMVTGRTDAFDSLRQAGGLSGYPSRTESAHDVVENSHASTALSYADGLAKARQLNREQDRAVVAVIGDGAMTGGMAWEALNNIGAAPARPVIVVLNDNGRSYAPTHGALAAHLQALKTGTPSRRSRNLFTDLGFAYLGPVNGHDTAALQQALKKARAAQRPVVVHVLTVKGKGYAPAESDPADCLHAVGPAPGPSAGKSVSWTSVFGEALVDLGHRHDEVVALTAAMAGPTGLSAFAAAFPDRCFDVGIAEQHAVTSAAGLAMGGLHPVVAVYATFLSRAFDQTLMDVALHRMPVTFVLDRAGITGPDGASHHGMWDLTLLGAVPGLRVAVPRDATRMRELLTEAVTWGKGPTALRFPKATVGPDIDAARRDGCVDILYTHGSRDVLLVPTGPLAAPALQAARNLSQQGIGVTVADPRWILPTPPELLHLAARHRLVVTVEDNTRSGGFGTAVARDLADTGSTVPVRTLGLPHAFLPHGTRSGLLDATGLGPNGILHAVLRARAGNAHHDPHLSPQEKRT